MDRRNFLAAIGAGVGVLALPAFAQSPLANPDADAYKKSANTRLWKIDRATGKVLGEYVYVMDDPTSFGQCHHPCPFVQSGINHP